MSFILAAELRPQETKQSRSGRRRPESPATAAGSNIPVFERRKMFEETDGSSSGDTKPTVAEKRLGRFSSRKGDNGRASSFRGSKKMKAEDGAAVVRAKQTPTSGLCQRLRNFGHYDLQSMAIERLGSESGSSGEHSASGVTHGDLAARKKATGASAAHYEEIHVGDGRFNELVAKCPAFRNEVGGNPDWLRSDASTLLLRESLSIDKQKRLGARGNLVLDGELPSKELSRLKGPMSKQVSALLQSQIGIHYPLEFIDYGAAYFRNHFLGQEHQNFIGIDENLGPVAISLKREKVSDDLLGVYGTVANVGPVVSTKHQYRVLLRTSELRTLRGTIPEEVIPSGTKTGTSKGLPPRDVVDYISHGELQLSGLKVAKQEKKVYQELVRLDEQELNNKYKIGVLYCKRGQTTEEDMYNNAKGSSAFDEFMALLGTKVKMKGFTKYRAQLDNKTDTTGEYSVYTEFRDVEVMFHVSTLLPYTPSNRQQLLKKRHIGNDIVTVIFQEPGSEPFSPKVVRSQFQHIFIVVRVNNPLSPYTKYRVAVARSQDIPYFGPTIPEGGTFDRNEQFKQFLLTKLINACNASLRSKKFLGMAIRTRRQYLTDLAENYTTGISIDQANAGLVGFLAKNWGGKKRERSRNHGPLILTPGALTWNVSIILREGKPLPFSEDHDVHIDCILGLSPDLVVLLDASSKEHLLHIPSKDLIGWLQDGNRLNMFYDSCHCISMESFESEDDIKDIATRMQALAPKLSPSHEATLMDFRRGPNGLLGFGINEAGVVQKVDGVAKSTGLQTGSRLLQVEDRLVSTHTHTQIMELLTDRHRTTVRAYVIPPTPKSFRLPMYYPALNWSAIWASRPSHADEDTGGKATNGPEPMQVSPVVARRKTSNNSNRYSYIEAVSEGGQINASGKERTQPHDDDEEPIYDRLMTIEPGTVILRSRSPRPGRVGLDKTAGYTRVRRVKAVRESVVQFADDLMERKLTQGRNAWTPEPIEHTVSVCSPEVQMHFTTSTSVPQHKPQIAAPLSKIPGHRRSASDHRHLPPSGIPVFSTSPKSDMPMTPGQVHELTKRFSFTPTGGAKAGVSRVSGEHGTPLRATTAAAEMTKPGTHQQSALASQHASGLPGKALSAENEIHLRGVPNKKGIKVRPMSWDASLIFSSEKENAEKREEDAAMVVSQDDSAAVSQGFSRNSNARVPVRRKSSSSSHEKSPEPEVRERAHTVARGPKESRLQKPSTREQLSQGSGSSQEENITPVSVRERTMRWEARGSDLPSYFSTLPRSFRHKASSKSVTTPTRPHSHTLKRMTTLASLTSSEEKPQSGESTKRRHMSVATMSSSHSSRIPSPRTSLVQSGEGGPLQQSSKIPLPGGSQHQGAPSRQRSASEHDPPKTSQLAELPGTSVPGERPSNDEEAWDGGEVVKSADELPLSEPPEGVTKGSEGLLSKEEQGSLSKASHLPVIKSRIVVSSTRSRGRGLLPTKTQVSGQTSSSATTAKERAHNVEGKGQVVSPSHKGASTANPTHQRTPSRGSSIPRPTHHKGTIEAVQTENGHIPTAQKSSSLIPRSSSSLGREQMKSSDQASAPSPSHLHHNSVADGSSSLENSLDTTTLQSGVQSLSLSDDGHHQGTPTCETGSGYRGSIEDWIKDTSESAVVPDALVDEGRDGVSSPTPTDGSLSYSQMSDSQDVIETLKQRIEMLESQLEKESESNVELRKKIQRYERHLHEAQVKQQNKHTVSVKSAFI